MDSVDRLLKTIRGVSKTNPVTNLQLSEIIRRLWSDQGKIINIINNEIVNNTTNIYQSISQIIGSKQGDNHESILIENTVNVSETVLSSWSVIPYNQQMGEFKAVVAVRNKINNTIITLISLLSFDYSDAIPALIQNDLLTDAALSLTVGVDGSNMLYATVAGMPEDDKRIHFCLERCVLSERAWQITADGTFEMNVSAQLTKYLLAQANVTLELNGSAALTDSAAVSEGLVLTWDDIVNVPVADVSSVSDWNTFFDLPTNGTPFTSVLIDGNTVILIGGSNITIKESLFGNSTSSLNLLKIEDVGSAIVYISYDAFGDDNGDGCLNLTDISFPNCTEIASYAFIDNTSLINVSFPLLQVIGEGVFMECNSIITLNFPSLTYAGTSAFENCESLEEINLPVVEIISTRAFMSNFSLKEINAPILSNLGGTVTDDLVFGNTTGTTIVITIPSALMTCNGGNPDGDIQYLQANNTVTIITV